MDESKEVTVLFFSLFRDITGVESRKISLKQEETVSSLVELIFAEFPGLRDWNDRMLLAVNCEYADRNQIVHGGDEIAMMPPVQGG